MKLIISIILLTNLLLASDISTKKLNINISNNEYKISIENKNNVYEKLVSKGKIVNNKFVPYRFKKTIEKTNKIINLTYIFDYENKIVIFEKILLEKLKNITMINDKNVEEYYWNISVQTQRIEKYLNNDILSLILNINKINSNKVDIIGLNDNEKSSVNIEKNKNFIVINTNNKKFLYDINEVYLKIKDMGKKKILLKSN